MNSQYTLHFSPVVDCVVVSGTDVHVGVLSLDGVAVNRKGGKGAYSNKSHYNAVFYIEHIYGTCTCTCIIL